ncbi:MAG: glycosyltransferase family 1 protein [Methylomonas sp.]|nr:glycosyltransferase family 1 protein [Methylomonas sp.]PPD22243.1 MAG: hypothetical protein CTY23_02780 [Methylomonas sp.]PPD27779.1 MAG: hypothetical protein CTY22_01070 [Methylomonas sp.]PPD39789.1 MAG: hypothetical protein CTY21_01065 [Methylomonas sp.]PPD42563.1 MAG: hypothetical protein CTY17_00960 [Methylomonas sp.]
MKLEHLGLFMPGNTPFYRRVYGFLRDAFAQLGIRVSGGCGLLSDAQMHDWLAQYRPDAVFEMNRVKDEVPSLHQYRIPHIAWIVDFQGRTEAQISGSEITYFFDPGWDANYRTGGVQDWLPPGTCSQTFQPLPGDASIEVDFNFIGHIPLPWSNAELARRMTVDSDMSFGDVLKRYDNHLRATRDQIKTHGDLKRIIDDLLRDAGTPLPPECLNAYYYDLMERTKRVQNRTELLNFALAKSASVAIYGSSNWAEWQEYKAFYRHFLACPAELNRVHQHSRINLHDGVSFHFRAIDCLASGGLLFWYDNDEVDAFRVPGRGLHDHFDDRCHYLAFKRSDFEQTYQNALECLSSRASAITEVRAIIQAHHTWRARAEKILHDLAYA